MHADSSGHPVAGGPGAGLPLTIHGTGAGHGGRGGRSHSGFYTAYSYGSTFLPDQPGSGGGGAGGGRGGGK